MRQAATAYRVVTDALADVAAPVKPPSLLRERLVDRVAREAAREAEQFELAANILALEAAVSVKPEDSVRERLLSRIEVPANVRPELRDPASVLRGDIHLPMGDEHMREGRRAFTQGFFVSLSAWLRSCRRAVSDALRIFFIRSATSERVRFLKAKMTFQQPIKGLTFIKASEGAWRGIAPGVTAKLLSFDPVSRRTTTVLRFAAGTRYAPHRHTAVEELYVLEGGCSIAGREMAVGDYHRAEVGTVHHDTSTDEGCLLLVISSPRDELLS